MSIFVVMKWKGPSPETPYFSGSKVETQYESEHVNRIFQMVNNIYGKEARFICLTDDPSGLRHGVEAYPIPSSGIEMINHHGGRFFKLFLFSKEFGDFIQQKFIYMDLDAAICGNVDALFENSAPVVILQGSMPTPTPLSLRAFISRIRRVNSFSGFFRLARNPAIPWCKYNSSVIRIDPLQIDHDIWDNLDIVAAKAEIQKNNIIGTDQACLHVYYTGEVSIVNENDGIWHFQRLNQFRAVNGKLPDLVNLVVFPGKPSSKPWIPEFRKQFPWVENLYPLEADS